MTFQSSPDTPVDWGSSMGTYRGRSIPRWFVTAAGQRQEFNRLAVLDRGGGCDLRQLACDECVVAPGLIYKAVPR